MKMIEESMLIACPVEVVWKFMSNIENAPQWNHGVLTARKVSEGPLGVGSVLQTTRQMLGRRRTPQYVV